MILDAVPRVDGDDLVGAELQASASARGVVTQQNIHDGKELLDALVLSEVFATFDQERVVALVVAADDQTLGTTDGRHHLDLRDTTETPPSRESNAAEVVEIDLCCSRTKNVEIYGETYSVSDISQI